MGQEAAPFKEAFAQYLNYQAEWRDLQATEHPEDGRNARSAEGLNAFARYVRALPDDDPRLLEMGNLCGAQIADLGLYSPWPQGRVSYMVVRFRFHNPDEAFEALLDELVKAETQDQIDRAEQAGDFEFDFD